MRYSVLNEMLENHHSDLTSLFIRDWVMDIDIGIFEHEIGNPQPVSIDLEVHISGADAPERDEIDAVIDYDYMRAVVARVLDFKRYNLLETLASEILDGCMMPSEVIGAAVTVTKLSVLEDGGRIGCTLTRMR
ncbi:MAG: dihydroneopterin aldolase [Euryarchaeota archaeon]|nr:dihydroneopterin aldolase [Euryarchaeota archaeon]|tara:strand:+ start:915 stop:1313 length:399 start_codon:yes stop_codon:yes gene_type:complete